MVWALLKTEVVSVVVVHTCMYCTWTHGVFVFKCAHHISQMIVEVHFVEKNYIYNRVSDSDPRL